MSPSNSSTLRLDLKSIDVWDMRQLNPEIRKAIWPEEIELVEVSSLAKRVRPNAFSPEAPSTVRPSAVNARSGSISQITNSARDLFYDWEDDGIRENDLAIHSNGAIFLTEKLRSILFSSEFIVLRSGTKKDSVFLWSIFNSTKGLVMLSEIFKRDQLSRPLEIQDIVDNLLTLKVPVLMNFDSASREKILELISNQKHELSIFEDKRRSWLQKVALDQASDWFYSMTINDFSSWQNERPITDLLEEIILGRIHEKGEEEVSGELVPLATVKFINRQILDDLDYVFPHPRDIFGLPGDLLMASVAGKTYLYPLTFKCILSHGILALRPRPSTSLEELLQVLQSKTVVDQISYFQSKRTFGGLTRKDFELVRIPLKTHLLKSELEGLAPLSLQIDALLWS